MMLQELVMLSFADFCFLIGLRMLCWISSPLFIIDLYKATVPHQREHGRLLTINLFEANDPFPYRRI
jgi:hypothetical protein